MKVRISRGFAKQYSSLDNKIKAKFRLALRAWRDDQFASGLNNHALAGEYHGYRSINVTGDFRAIYQMEGPEIAVFVAIGKHSQLYR
jgi:addiction module RelE/StbE family toxin